MMTDAHLLKLYDVASTNAANDDLTGLTVYYRKTMFHIREGDPQLVSNSIIRAESQGWTYNMSIVEDAMYETRLFDEWNLSFIPEDEASLRHGKNLLNFAGLREHSALARAMLDPMFSTFFEVYTAEMDDEIAASDVEMPKVQTTADFIEAINAGATRQA